MSKLAHSNKATMDEIEARRMEDEANEFAMELLMPTRFLEAELEKMGSFDIEDDRPLKALANKFRVSPQVMLWRLARHRNRKLSSAEPTGK